MITHHASTAAGLSQCDIILALLRRHQGSWVSLPDLANESGSMAVHSRIADLRARGLTVDHRNQRKGRMVHSSYRLPATEAHQASLF